jgi:hypothetical protein
LDTNERKDAKTWRSRSFAIKTKQLITDNVREGLESPYPKGRVSSGKDNEI